MPEPANAELQNAAELKPKLLAKDQLLELLFYIAFGSLVATPSPFSLGIGGFIILESVICTISLALLVIVNLVRRYFWRRRQMRRIAISPPKQPN